jgi:hypothetical protein
MNSSNLKKALKILLYSGLAAFVLWLLLFSYSADWTGFGDFIKPNGEFVRGKTLWDWMDLFIIPASLFVGGYFLNKSERASEREIAADRIRETALQNYLDRMTELLLKEKLRTSKNIEVRNVARTRTLSVLRGLDKERKGTVIRFLSEADLLRVVELVDADLTIAGLSYVSIVGGNLAFAQLGFLLQTCMARI